MAGSIHASSACDDSKAFVILKHLTSEQDTLGPHSSIQPDMWHSVPKVSAPSRTRRKYSSKSLAEHAEYAATESSHSFEAVGIPQHHSAVFEVMLPTKLADTKHSNRGTALQAASSDSAAIQAKPNKHTVTQVSAVAAHTGPVSMT
jgi:hypothetical protein